MEANPYFSFLVCDHPGVINVFSNGLPLGIIRTATFTFEPDPLFDKWNPFSTADGLAKYLRDVASAIETAAKAQTP